MCALLVACGVVSCAAPGDEPASGSPEDSTREVTWTFTDVTGAAGIDFVHVNDASANRFLPETMGSGAAFADFDGDALPDVYLVNGAPLSSTGAGPGGRLYRNAGDGRFEDVSALSGLDGSFYGMGAAVADVDRDGAIDLFVTAVGQDRLFRNTGDRRFEDVTIGSGLDRSDGAFSTSAAFLDFDRDGDPDVFVCRYVAWSAETDLECRPDGVHRAYCTPERYPAIGNQLWRNDTSSRGIAFTEVSVESGIAAAEGKALGVAVFDHDGDGWPDVIVANDTVRNFLFRNRGDGTFDEIGVEAGIAYSESGAARGAWASTRATWTGTAGATS